MGTVVLASDDNCENRKLIIDGQQRITTTAILFIAIRDHLHELDQRQAAQSVENTHLSNYVLTEEQTVAKLTLSADDHKIFDLLLQGNSIDQLGDDRLSACYRQLKTHIDKLALRKVDYRRLIELVDYLDKQVQVLLAVASGLPEAYVIFETLNDRGADLTTADLLKKTTCSIKPGETGSLTQKASGRGFLAASIIPTNSSNSCATNTHHGKGTSRTEVSIRRCRPTSAREPGLFEVTWTALRKCCNDISPSASQTMPVGRHKRLKSRIHSSHFEGSGSKPAHPYC
jgi:Protein of unknown function DUF262